MNLYGVRAVVLNSRSMRDADRLLTLYSLEKGKIQAIAHGVNKPTSRKRGAVQPFCHSDFMLRRGRELDTVSQCEGLDIFPGLWGSLEKMGYAAHVAEAVEVLTEEGEPNQALFALLLNTLRRLETASDPALTARGFELKLVSLLGYRPHLDSCVNCGNESLSQSAAFSVSDGGLVCLNCRTNDRDQPCSGETVAIMKLLLSAESVKVARLRVSTRSRDEMQRVMKHYLQWLTEKRSRSMRFMESVLEYREK
ncbi:MAG: DNA repair protein RecO [Firmicutes bacterium]|nr:DNA repair protein RecO [Bacillota bacterium]